MDRQVARKKSAKKRGPEPDAKMPRVRFGEQMGEFLRRNMNWFLVVGFALLGTLMFVIFDRAGTLTPHAASPMHNSEIAGITGGTQKLGVYLFQHQTINLELAGLILTVSMVGAIVIARKLT